MIAVIFEVWPAKGCKEDYLTIAKQLRDELAGIDGFVSVERYQSLTEPEKMLSLSFFTDEEAVTRWREQTAHRAAQQSGRNGIFADYRLSVAQVCRSYGLHDRSEVPK